MLYYPMKYILSICYVLFMIIFCQSLGKKICGNKRFTLNLIYGFVFYTALQAIGGIVIQTLQLDFLYYKVYMIVLILALTTYKLEWQELRTKVIVKNICAHFKIYYPLYIVTSILLFFSLINIGGLWNSNRQDDGWYITQIEQLSKMGSAYTIHAPTGFSYKPSIMRVVNTFEIEASFYSSILTIPASIFVKVALSFFQYFLLSACVSELGYRIFKEKNYGRVFVFLSICVLLFGLTSSMLRDNNMLVLTDDWQFNSAMGYGSSVVRTMGILLFIPILDKKLFSRSTIVYGLAVCVALMTKGSQALPVLFIVIASMVIIWVTNEMKGNKQKIVIVSGVLFLLLFPRIGSEFNTNFESAYSIFWDNFEKTGWMAMILLIGYSMLYLSKKSREYLIPALPFVLILSFAVGNLLLSAALVFICASKITNKYIQKWNLFMILLALLMFLPMINTIFIDLSIYDFVVKRATTLYFITFILTSAIEGIYLLSLYHINEKKLILLASTIGVTLSCYFIFQYQNTYSIVHALAVLKNNAELIPESTLELGNVLEKIADEKGKPVNVVMPVSFSVDQCPHYPYILLRLHNQNVRSVSAVARYGQEESEEHDLAVRGYSYGQQNIIDQMNRSDVDVKHYENDLKEILSNFPIIDTFVVSNPSFRDLLAEEFDFELVDAVSIGDSPTHYFILYKEFN